jgi:tetratricopeptide (TPR) repeat protein
MPARPNSARQAKAGTSDPIELALEETNGGRPGREAAYVLLDRQARLIGWQIAGERMGVALKVLGGLVGLLAALLFGSMVFNAARSKAVVVQALDTPPSLAEQGLSGRVVAGKLQDGLTLIQATTRATAKGRAIANAWTGDIAVEVAQTGVSIGEVDRLLRERLGRNTYVSGDLVQTPDGRIALTVRGGSILARTFTGPRESIDDLARQAAEYIYGEAEPYLYATYLNQNDRSAEVIPFAQRALASAEAAERAPLANTTGLAYSNVGSSESAVQWYRLAIQYDPTFWRSWGNLVGELLMPGTEEEAYRVGQQMIAANESSTTTHANRSDQANVYLLTQDWPAYVEGTIEDAVQTGGLGTTTVITANPSIAEGEARRHDWAAAARYMALADPSDALSAPTGQLIWAYRAIEERRFGDAVTLLEPFHAAWMTDEDLAFTYHDAPCWLALAYDLTGQRTKAREIYDQMGALVTCYALQADGVEATGDRVAADAAYRRAIALAPSIPFAYQRRAVALMRRGEFKMAAGRFRDAHQRGPNWADPLKGWGDALAAQGLWARAVEKYEQAEPLAPNWRDLHLAHAVASDRLGRGREAAAVRRKLAG